MIYDKFQNLRVQNCTSRKGDIFTLKQKKIYNLDSSKLEPLLTRLWNGGTKKKTNFNVAYWLDDGDTNFGSCNWDATVNTGLEVRSLFKLLNYTDVNFFRIHFI